MIPQALFIIGLAAGVSAGLAGVYFEGRKAGRAEVQAADALARDIAQQATDAALAVTAKAISQIKVRHQTITQEVQREISERVVYRDCLHSPEQLQRLNDALTGAQPQPAGTGLLPRTDASGRADLRRDDAQAP